MLNYQTIMTTTHSSAEGASADVEATRRSLGKLHKLEESVGVRPMTWDSSVSNYVPMTAPDLSTRMLELSILGARFFE